jgi:predicted ATPase/Tfp pilus assembly protein PilF
MVEQPSGTVTLVFTDVEGSTRLLQELGRDAYLAALEQQRGIVRAACARHAGYEVDTAGDGFFYAFAAANDAVAAIEETMAGLHGHRIRVRVGVHTGEPGLDPPKYVGLDVHMAARIMAAGHGGQVVLSQSTRDLLDDSFTVSDLGEHRLKDLSGPRRLYQLGAGGFPPLKTLYRTNLPVPATAFIGRGQELEDLTALLDGGARLLTLTGPGGTGKTRLALQAVAAAADGYPDGIWWVPLASLRDAGLLLSSVAQALDVREKPDRDLGEALVDRLSAGRTILLLDNLEHLLPAAAEAVATLRDAGGVTVVVTSRERLQLSGEHVYPVLPLAAPDAVELFSARAAALGAEVGEAATDSVAELCARLDNLPLAVELAAARTGLLPPGEILSRLGGRLDRLRAGRDADPRQQTLRATIAWSHDLLDPGEQELFAQFAVFAGGATLDAVEAVCHEDLDVLTSLLDKSLVRRSGERVWMLETIREYADEQLGASPAPEALHDRHAAYYLALAETSDTELKGHGQGIGQRDALERFVVERANLRAALEWLLDRDPPAALQLTHALSRSSAELGHFNEARAMLGTALERAGPEPSEAKALCLGHASWFAWEQGESWEAFRLVHDSLACARSARSTNAEIRALTNLASGYLEQQDAKEQIRLGQEAIALARAYGDKSLLAEAIGSHGTGMNHFGETEKANELWQEAYRLSRELGDDSGSAGLLNNLGWNAMLAGDTVAARAWLEESLELSRRNDNPHRVSYTIVNLGWIELLEGNLEPARACFEEGAALARQMGLSMIEAEALWGFAQAAAAAGDPDRAARLAGAAAAIGEPAGFDPVATITFTHHLDAARATLGEDAWHNAWDSGAALNLDDALELALER